MAVLQANMEAACTHAASRLDARKSPFEAIGVPVSPELKALTADTLRVGGEIFGPLPDDVRQRLRSVLYDVMETLPPTQAERTSFLTNLADQFFIPNGDAVRELSDQLLAISRQRFQLFVERVLESGAALLSKAVEDVINHVVQVVLGWVTDLEHAIVSLQNDIRQLAQLIQTATAEVQQSFADAIQKLNVLIDQFSSQELRTPFREAVTNAFLQIGKGVLAGNPLYRSLPRELRKVVRGILQDAINDAVDAPILNPFFDAIQGLAGTMEGALDDIRELNPSQPLGPQILDLLIDRMEDRIRATFGSNPRISVAFNVSLFGFSQHFGLGSLELPLANLFTLLRTAINNVNFYGVALEQAAAALSVAFGKSIDLTAKQDSRARKAADLSRLNQIRSDFTPDPKTIVILNPVQSLVYDDDITVQIHLGNVPSSYLGLNKDEQQRVLIFLNGALMPVESLILNSSSLDVNSDKPSQLRPGVTVERPVSRVAVRQPETNKFGASVPDAKLPLPRFIGALAENPARAPARPVLSQTVQNNGTVSTTVGNLLAGRRMTLTKRDSLQQDLLSGIAVQFLARRGQLIVGTNSLAVVVIDPAGKRYQQVVSFGILPSVTALQDGARLPAAPGRREAGDPVVPSQGIDLHFNSQALLGRLKDARSSFDQGSAAHFATFKKRP